MSKSKHAGDFEIIERNADNTRRTWLASCACGEKRTGETYEAAEDKWRQHVYETTGTAPNAWGDKSNRWQPPAADLLALAEEARS